MSRYGGFINGKAAFRDNWDALKGVTDRTEVGPAGDFSYLDAKGVWGMCSTVQFPASNTIPEVPTFALLETVSLTTSASSVTFSSISQDYKHLQIRAVTPSSGSSPTGRMRFNADTGSNYSWHALFGNGSSVSSIGLGNQNEIVSFYVGFSRPLASVIDILDYTNTNKYTTSRSLFGGTDLTDFHIWLTSGSWRNTNAVNQIELYADSLFASGSRFSLYGIKG